MLPEQEWMSSLINLLETSPSICRLRNAYKSCTPSSNYSPNYSLLRRRDGNTVPSAISKEPRSAQVFPPDLKTFQKHSELSSCFKPPPNMAVMRLTSLKLLPGVACHSQQQLPETEQTPEPQNKLACLPFSPGTILKCTTRHSPG